MTTITMNDTPQIVLSLHNLNELFDTLRAEQLVYLDGQCVDWYGQIVPIVLLPNGLPALRVDLLCPHCDENTCTVYAAWNEYGAWTTLLEADGTFLVDLCDADLRGHLLLCNECAYLQEHPITIEDIRHEAALLEFNVDISNGHLDLYHRADQATGFWSIALYNDPLVLVGAWQFLQERRAYLDQLDAARRELVNRLSQRPRKRSWLIRCLAKWRRA